MTTTKTVTDSAVTAAPSSEKQQQQQQQQLERNEGTTGSVLRAHAPAFVPSTANLGVPGVADTAADAGKETRKENQCAKKDHTRSRRRKQPKRKQERRPESTTETDTSESKTPNTENQSLGGSAKNRKNRNRNTNRNRNRNRCKNNGKPDCTQQSKSQASNKNRRTRRERQKRTSASDCPEKRDRASPIRTRAEAEEESPRDVHPSYDSPSAAFPALVEPPAAGSSSHTTWKAFPGILRDEPEDGPGEDPASQIQERESWKNGLDRLGASRERPCPKQRRNRWHRSEFSAWDENDEESDNNNVNDDDDDDDDDNSDAAEDSNALNGDPTKESGTEVTTRAMALSETNNSAASWKRTFDMHRLRDRWWVAVAKQQQRLVEQQQRLVEQQRARELEDEHHRLHRAGIDDERCSKNNCDAHADADEDADADADEIPNYHYSTDGHVKVQDYSEANSSSSSDTNHDAEHDHSSLSALHQHVQNNSSLNENETSKKTLLDSIIAQNDDRALREMLELSCNRSECWYDTAPMHSCDEPDLAPNQEDSVEDVLEYSLESIIRRNKTDLLRSLLSITKGRIPIHSQPLIQAARLGREECASILLSKQDGDSTILFLKDDDHDGNTALHCCCGQSGEKEMVLVLLKQVAGNTKGKRQQLAKLVTARNKKLQTPLHLACESGRNDLVEVFLTTCKSSLLFKILSMEDVEHQTPLLTAVGNNAFDVVVSLLMWRGNHDHQRQKQSEDYSIYSIATDGYSNNSSSSSKMERRKVHAKAQKSTCPLVWAAKSGNLDMIDLLIQFGDQSGNVYRIAKALFVLLRSDAPAETKLKGSELLVLAGANPFEEIDFSGAPSGKKETAIGVAARAVPNEIIRSIISTAMRKIADRQLARRRDPVLQQQPEAFFRTLEYKESSEANSATTNALIETLFRANSSQKATDLKMAMSLYEQIEQVEDSYLARLQISILKGTIRHHPPEPRNWCLLATYQHSTIGLPADKQSKTSPLECDRSVFAEKSLRLLEIPWVKSEIRKTSCFCPWMRREAKKMDRRRVNHTAGYDLKLIANDGSAFVVHRSIVSEKSDKLASAYRFAEMNRDEDSKEEFISVEVGIPPDFCKLLIQHMYHGSICFGWPNLNTDDVCRYLLELMLVAEEFLMPALVQEIEMRLMSSKPRSCFCWDCCQTLRIISAEGGRLHSECLYLVDAKCSMVTKDSATDILGVTDYMVGLDYNICLAQMNHNACIEPRELWANYEKGLKNSEKKCWRVNKATVTLRDAAVVTVLKRFGSVVEDTDVFLASEGMFDIESQKQLLLQTCLEELKNNSVVAAGYKTLIQKSHISSVKY